MVHSATISNLLWLLPLIPCPSGGPAPPSAAAPQAYLRPSISTSKMLSHALTTNFQVSKVVPCFLHSSRIPKRLWLQKCVSWGEGPFLCPSLSPGHQNFSLDSANILWFCWSSFLLDSGNTHFPEAHLGPQGTNVWVSAQSQFQGMGWQTTRQTSMWISSLDPLHHTVTRAQMHLNSTGWA